MNPVMKALRKVKAASSQLAILDERVRCQVLLSLADLLRHSFADILIENQLDLLRMDENDPKYDRLRLTEKQINSMADDVERVAALAQPLGTILEERSRPNGLIIQKIAIPLGVIAVIYESRPNVTIDVFSLCFKTGNACILKGGKEAEKTNVILMSLIQKALKKQGITEHAAYLLPTERACTQVLLEAVDVVDVCIPRGSQALIQFVREHSKIPVIETGAGIVHTYFDRSGDVAKGQLIIDNAKTRRVSVCNALDSLVIHEECLEQLPFLMAPLVAKQVVLLADEPSYQALKSHYPEALLYKSRAEDYGVEFLSSKMSIKSVHSAEEAIRHIMYYSSGHSEAIIAEDKAVIHDFLQKIDAAAVYVNASTAFTDGGEFGMGAEIGISTQKLHARGPMGLDALTSYKWLIFGDGQIRI